MTKGDKNVANVLNKLMLIIIVILVAIVLLNKIKFIVIIEQFIIEKEFLNLILIIEVLMIGLIKYILNAL